MGDYDGAFLIVGGMSIVAAALILALPAAARVRKAALARGA
jgi:hypothetical protein